MHNISEKRKNKKCVTVIKIKLKIMLPRDFNPEDFNKREDISYSWK